MGTLTMANGDKYSGTFRNNMLQGSGTIQYQNADIFEGKFVDGRICGLGKLVSPANHFEYEGEFDQNLFHGEGTLTSTIIPGKRYTGQWQHGQRNGQGTMDWGNGSVYVGAWKNKLMHGVGKLTDNSDNSEYEGEYENG